MLHEPFMSSFESPPTYVSLVVCMLMILVLSFWMFPVSIISVVSCCCMGTRNMIVTAISFLAKYNHPNISSKPQKSVSWFSFRELYAHKASWIGILWEHDTAISMGNFKMIIPKQRVMTSAIAGVGWGGNPPDALIRNSLTYLHCPSCLGLMGVAVATTSAEAHKFILFWKASI